MSWWNKLFDQARGFFGKSRKSPFTSNACEHGFVVNLRQGTAEFELFVAQGEYDRGVNLPHGALHLGNLISYDPGNRQWRALLDSYLTAAGPNPESLIPRTDKAYYTTEALRAYIWHHQGRLVEAIELLNEVTTAKPDSRYLEAWGLPWLESPGAVEALSIDKGILVFVNVLSRFSEAKHLSQFRLRELQRWANVSERYFVRPGATKDPNAIMVRVGILRKAGHFKRAASVAQESLSQQPTWHGATALGLVLREAGGNDAAAEQAFRQALRINPDDVSVLLEAGDMYYQRRNWSSARTWYQEACQKQPGHPWAKPSQQYCQWKLTSDRQWLDSMIALAKQGNSRAIQLYHHEFFSEIDEPVDATANVLRQLRDAISGPPDEAPTGEVKLSLSSLECPSNFLAFRLEMAALKHDLKLKVAVDRIPKPDPRWPIEPVKYTLWDYVGTDASPGLPIPSQDVANEVAKLACEPFENDLNWASASRVAAKLGEGRIPELLATLVHPPPVPPGKTSLQWVPRVQQTVAQVIASTSELWENTPRRDALLAMLLGPQDWITKAAIHAMARIALDQPAYTLDIHNAFLKLAASRPDKGFCCWEYALYRAWLELPHLFPHEREDMESILRSLEQTDGE